MKRDDKIDKALLQRARVADWSRRWGGVAGGALLAAALAALLWYLLSDTAATRREMASAPMLMLPPPPPPPPPPPEPEKLPEPPPDEVVPEVVEPDPAPADKPMDDAPESPAPESAPVTMDSTAQAGTDAFGIQAGRGGGMTGSGAGGGGGGLGAGSYGRYVANALQQAFARDARTRLLAFSEIRIDLWLDAEGTATKAVLVQGTGNARTDELVLDMVREFRAGERPPASLRFPARVSIKGRRP